MASTLANNPRNYNAIIASKVKEIFQIHLDLTDINFSFLERKKYCANENQHYFRQNARSFICVIEFEIFNVPFTVKILYFEWDRSYEILKLDIEVVCPLVLKEIDYCKNYLQRRRNVNLLFLTLVQFTTYLEHRRAIVQFILSKSRRIQVTNHQDGGILIKYCNMVTKIMFGLNWKIQWKTNHTMNDIVEVYNRDLDLGIDFKDELNAKLVKLTHPRLPLQEKYLTWKTLLELVDNYNETNNDLDIVTYDLTSDRPPLTNGRQTTPGVVEISDSEDDLDELVSYGSRRGNGDRRADTTYDIVVLE